jgi:hypothetical protein
VGECEILWLGTFDGEGEIAPHRGERLTQNRTAVAMVPCSRTTACISHKINIMNVGIMKPGRDVADLKFCEIFGDI